MKVENLSNFYTLNQLVTYIRHSLNFLPRKCLKQMLTLTKKLNHLDSSDCRRPCEVHKKIHLRVAYYKCVTAERIGYIFRLLNQEQLSKINGLLYTRRWQI